MVYPIAVSPPWTRVSVVCPTGLEYRRRVPWSLSEQNMPHLLPLTRILCRWLPVLLGLAIAAGASGHQVPLRLAQIVSGPDAVIEPGGEADVYLRSTPRQRSAALSTEVKEVRIAQQFGLGYLPLMIARQYGLIEKHASAAGLGNIRVIWSRFPSGKSMNAALQAGFLDIASGGVGPLLRAWDETRGGREVKGIMALCSMPQFLNTIDPKVKTVRDFTEKARIALPATGVSGQAVLLQMVAARAFGPDQAHRLDKLTVSMSHPEAMASMLSGSPRITAHFASPPYQYQELQDPRVHAVLTSYSVLGGPSTFNATWAGESFYEENPKTFQAIYVALTEAMAMIEADRRMAAKGYILQSVSNPPVAFIERVISKPSIEFTPVPKHIMAFAKFMHRSKAIENLPDSWREVFFPPVHNESGS